MSNDNHQHEECDKPRRTAGSGHDADPTPPTPNNSPTAEGKPQQSDLERMANDVRHTRAEHPQAEDEPLEGELVQREIVRQEVSKVMTSIWSGPTPSPETLQAFNEINPTFAERAFVMSEESVAAANYERRVLADGDIAAVKRGQVISGLLAGAGMIGAVVSVATGHEVIAGCFLAPTIFQFLGTLVRTVRQKDPEKTSDSDDQ